MLINASVENNEIINPEADRPNISIKDLLGQVRLDQSKGEDFLSEKIILAMDNINDQTLLIALDTDKKIRYYKRAVCYEAAALIAEDNLDFDTTSAGQVRGENQQVKTQALRRTVNYCIGFLAHSKNGKGRRNRVSLI